MDIVCAEPKLMLSVYPAQIFAHLHIVVPQLALTHAAEAKRSTDTRVNCGGRSLAGFGVAGQTE